MQSKLKFRLPEGDARHVGRSRERAGVFESLKSAGGGASGTGA